MADTPPPAAQGSGDDTAESFEDETGANPSPTRSDTASGFWDLLPAEAEAMLATQDAILGEMRLWGYRYVMTPSIERLEAIARGLGPGPLRRLFKFADADGDLLALVSEKTVPVARMVAGPLRGAPLPIRLCYSSPVLAQSSDRFSLRRESHQAGGELIGAAGSMADAEVIALAARCLTACGLRNYHIDVGHAEFFQGIFESLQLPQPTKLAVKSALVAKDFVTLEGLLDATPLRGAEHELLLRFPALRGGQEMLEAAGALVQNSRSEAALRDLAEIWRLLEAHGLQGVVSLDLGAIRDFDYYTGMIFEAFGPDLGRPLASGGRYDRLLATFGRPAPATGFVVLLDLVADALGHLRRPPRLRAAISWAAGAQTVAQRLATSLRVVGLSAVVDTAPRSFAAAQRWCEEVDAVDLLHCQGERVRCRGMGEDLELSPDEALHTILEGAR